MKLYVVITTGDDKVHKYTCTDYPYISPDFVTLYLEGFRRTSIATKTIFKMESYLK